MLDPVVELRRRAAVLSGLAEEARLRAARLRATVDGLGWTGAAADRFRGRARADAEELQRLSALLAGAVELLDVHLGLAERSIGAWHRAEPSP